MTPPQGRVVLTAERRAALESRVSRAVAYADNLKSAGSQMLAVRYADDVPFLLDCYGTLLARQREARELLRAYFDDDHNAEHYKRGIGTATPRGKRWLAARAYLSKENDSE